MQVQTITRLRAASNSGVLLIALAALSWGTVGISTRALYAITATNALSIGFLRLAVASPALMLACWLFCGRKMFRITMRDWGLIALMGACVATYQVCLFSAIQFVGVSIAVVVTLCTAPVFVALASVRLFGEPITRWVLLALGCAVGGTLLLSGGGVGLATSTVATLTGVGLALGSALGYGILTLISRVLAPRYHPLQPMAFGFTIGAAILLPVALSQGLVIDYPAGAWSLLIYLGLLPTALAYVIYLFGMRTVTATTASVIALIEPLTAAVLAWLLFGEQFGLTAFAGAALLIGSILLLLRGAHQR